MLDREESHDVFHESLVTLPTYRYIDTSRDSTHTCNTQSTKSNMKVLHTFLLSLTLNSASAVNNNNLRSSNNNNVVQYTDEALADEIIDMVSTLHVCGLGLVSVLFAYMCMRNIIYVM